MVKCPKCASDNSDGSQFCRICGETLPVPEPAAPEAPASEAEYREAVAPSQNYQAPQSAPAYQAPQAAPVYRAPQGAYQAPQGAYQAPQSAYQAPQASQKSLPEMTWGSFFWTRVLFAIPVVGFIFMMIWACGGTSNRTRVQYARSYLFPGLIILGICLIVFIIFAIIAGADGVSLSRMFRRMF